MHPSRCASLLLPLLISLLPGCAHPTAATAPLPAFAPRTAADIDREPRGGRIRVGIMFSHFTSSDPSESCRDNFGYEPSTGMVHRLADPSTSLYAVIEPGTENLGHLPGVLREFAQYIPPDHVLRGDDVAALSKMDVLVLSQYSRVPADVADALLQAVRNGSPALIKGAVGGDCPGPTPACLQLMGLASARYGHLNQLVEARVAANHPLLASLPDPSPGKPIALLPGGAFGPFAADATPLLAYRLPAGPQASSSSAAAAKPAFAPADNPVIYPLYVTHVGKGKVLACMWLGIPKDFARRDPAYRFYLNGVHWLAGKTPRPPVPSHP